MPDLPDDLEDLLALALDAAVAGGEVLSRHAQRIERIPTESKGSRRELVTAADREAEAAVVGKILAGRPGDAVLAEEGALTPAGRVSREARHLWIVDPLDGTTNFVHGLPYHAVAVGLTIDGVPAVGVVHAPALGRTWAAATGLGATRDGAVIRVSQTDELADALVATGFSYARHQPGHEDNVDRIRAVLPACRDLRRYGSAQLDLCLVADGSMDGYWELDLAPYDVAAGAVVVREAGGVVTDLRLGDDWLYGGRILATNGGVHAELSSIVGDDGAWVSVPGGSGAQ
jgi:myo-inositol-1(or 4)-monophosphatase